MTPEAANTEATLKRPIAAADELPTVAAVTLVSSTVRKILLGRFRLLEEIGRGGMGTVYSAHDTLMQGEPLVAIKLLNNDFRVDAAAVTALERECRRVRMLAHEAVVRVFEFYRSDEYVFITMELLQGEAFDQVIKRYPRGMPFAVAWPLIREAATALSYSHRQTPPCIHYDFKPKNVFLTKQNHVKVLDFGVARAIRPKEGVDTTHLYETAMPGFLTAAYASCEMLAGLEPDPRDDVYALSCFTYEVLAGVHPFGGMAADKARTLGLKPLRIPSLDEARNRALYKGLAFERIERTSCVDEFVAGLDERKAAAAETRAPASARRRTILWISALAIMASAAIGVWLIKRPQIAQTSPPTVAGAEPGNKVAALYGLLGISGPKVVANHDYPRAEVAATVRTAPRHIALGSTPVQIQAAFDLCRHYVGECPLGIYADERARKATLSAFLLDATAVTVDEFGKFIAATQYKTQAEDADQAYALNGATLRAVRGGNWRNAVGKGPAPQASAVVGVSFRDAQRYCQWKQQRLPTEDEWEYVARGPERHVFPWGDDVTPAVARGGKRPGAADGLAGGIADSYFGLSGNVWEWVDTQLADQAILKGGSWLEANPANKRSAARRTDSPDRADSDSGFRCAKSVPAWPDADFWLERFL
jgi:formylglycine-generating enzyme required for sulfatase activity